MLTGGLCAFLAFAIGQMVVGQAVVAQTLEDELATLLDDHPEIQAARNRLLTATGAVDEAFSRFLPQVDLSGDTGYEYTDSPALRSVNDSPLSTSRDLATLDVTQNLFDGFDRSANLDAANLGRQSTELALEATTQRILLEGVVAYHNVLRQTRLVELARANEATIGRQLNLEDERVRRGGGITVDVLLAKTRLQIAKEQRVAFQGQLVEAQTDYNEVFDRAPRITEMVEPIPPVALLPPSVTDAVDIALKENPDVIGSERDVDVADRQRTVARSGYFPRIDLVGRASWEDDVEGVRDIRREASLLVRLTWNLFSGWATRARVAQASSRYSEQIATLTSAQRRVAETVRITWTRLETARERVDLLQNAVNIASEVFEARKRLREAAQESAINVLDAETELYNAQINSVNASYDARIATYSLLRAIGRLKPEILRLPTRVTR